MASLGATHDLLARALAIVALSGGVLAAIALLTRRGAASTTPAAAPELTAGDELVGAAFSGVVAGALALALGGPGALVWLVLAAAVGVAVRGAERAVSPDMSRVPGPVGQTLRAATATAATLAALAAGALLLAQQAAEVTRAAFPLTTAALAAILALGTGVFLLARPAAARLRTGVGLAALVLFVGVCLALLVRDPSAAGAALRSILAAGFETGAAVGGLLGVAAHGVLRAAVAGATGGLGPSPSSRRPSLAPLVAGGLALLTALALLTVGADERAPVTDRALVPLEPNLRAGLLPSDYGQMIGVSPATRFEPGQRYPVVLRSDPRGHRVGQLFRDENIVAVPAWDLLRDVDTVILRDKDPERAKNPGFDLRIAVTREQVDTPRGPYLKLTPVDPAINIRQLMVARSLDGPYLEFADYPFAASVARGFRMQDGEGLSLYEEPRPPGAPINPTLRELVTLNLAGPYPSRPDEPRPPLALVAPEASGFEPGSLAHLRLEAPERGLDLGFVNGLDELEVPPWQFLAACDTAVLRHKTDPALDLEIRVTHRLAFGRLRFTSPDVHLGKLATAYPEHTGPHLRPPAYRFTAEVHPGARLSPTRSDGPAISSDSLALVPVHMQAAPTGNPGWGIYDPHPGEVLLTGMTGPWRDEDAAAALVRSTARAWGPAHAGIAAICLLVLALVGLAAWARAGEAAARRLFGPAVGPAFALVFVVCVALGPGLALVPLLRLADVTVAVAVLLGVAGLVAGLPLRRT